MKGYNVAIFSLSILMLIFLHPTWDLPWNFIGVLLSGFIYVAQYINKLQLDFFIVIIPLFFFIKKGYKISIINLFIYIIYCVALIKGISAGYRDFIENLYSLHNRGVYPTSQESVMLSKVHEIPYALDKPIKSFVYYIFYMPYRYMSYIIQNNQYSIAMKRDILMYDPFINIKFLLMSTILSFLGIKKIVRRNLPNKNMNNE